MNYDENGSALIQGLISICIISYAILGTLGFQMKMQSENIIATQRLTASIHMDSLIGAAEADPNNYMCYQYPIINCDVDSQNDCTAVQNYVSAWATKTKTLIGAQSNPPVAVLDCNTGNLTVSIYWKLPSELNAEPVHSLNSTIHPVVRG